MVDARTRILRVGIDFFERRGADAFFIEVYCGLLSGCYFSMLKTRKSGHYFDNSIRYTLKPRAIILKYIHLYLLQTFICSLSV